jgi:hypothetical protein
VLRLRQQAKLAGDINHKEHAMSQKFREGPWPKTGTESAKLTRIYKTPPGTCTLSHGHVETRFGVLLRTLV